MNTQAADLVLLRKHLSAARGHLQSAVTRIEGLAGQPGADLDACYSARRELKHLADTLTDLIGNWEAV